MTLERTVAKNLLLLALAGVGLTSGCASTRDASGPPPAFQTRDEIDEGPPRLTGAGADLQIRNDVLSGQLEGGSYNVKLTPSSAEGSGPLGRVDLHIKPIAQGYDLTGLWNGGRVHLIVGDQGARGSVMKQISGEDRGYESCHYDIGKLDPRTGQAGYAGLSECLGQNPLRFEIQPRATTDMTSEQNVILLLAYLAAPPPVRTY